MTTLQNGDKFLVQRTDPQTGISTNYQVSQENLMANLADDDLLLVQRTSAGVSTNYCISAVDLKADLGSTNGLIRPPVEVLTPINGAGITEFNQYEPLSSAITAVGEAGTLSKDTDEILSVADEIAWQASQVWSNYVTISEGNTGTNYNTDATNMFDGDTSTSTALFSGNMVSPYSPTTVVFTPPSAMTVNTGIRVYMAVNRQQKIFVNGNETNASVTSGWNDVAFTGTLTSLTIGPTQLGSSSNINAIEIDGLLLVDAGTSDTTPTTGNKVLSFPTNTNFSGLSVGDVVQSAAGINVTGPVILYHWTQNTSAGQEIYINGQKVALSASNSMQQLDITAEAGSIITSMEIRRSVTSGGAIAIAGISVDGNLITGSEFSSGWDPDIVWEGAGGAAATFDGNVTTVGQTYTGLPVAPSLGGLAVNTWSASNMSSYAGIAEIIAIDASEPSQQLVDVYATWDSSKNPGNNTLSNGNLTIATSSSGVSATGGTIAVSSGKWYYEFEVTNGGHTSVGFIKTSDSLSGFLGGTSGAYAYYSESGYVKKINNNVRTNYGEHYTTGDTIGVALDLDGGTITFYRNGVSQGQAFSGLSGTFIPAVSDGTSTAGITGTANFGQNAWTHEPPSGFVGLSEAVTTYTYPNITVSGGNWNTTNQSQVWSSNVSGTLFEPNYPMSKAFNGDLTSNNNAYANMNNTATVTFAGAPISFSTLRVYAQKFASSSTATFFVNGNDYTSQLGGSGDTSLGWYTITGETELTSIGIGGYNGNTDTTGLYAVEVDGKILVDAGIGFAAILDEKFTQNTYDSGDVTGLSYTHDPSLGISMLSTQSVIFKDAAVNVSSSANYHVYTSSNGINWTRMETGLGANSKATRYARYVAITSDHNDDAIVTATFTGPIGDRKIVSSIPYEKSLTFTDDTQLANMVGPLEMTDANGAVVTPVSDTIANVSGKVLTLASDTNLAYFRPGDEVQTGVQVVSVDTAAPSITVDGGSWYGADGTGSTYEISKSLRLDSADSSYLSRTPSSEGNRKTWTWSGWVKRSKLGTRQNIFGAGSNASYTHHVYMNFMADNTIEIESYSSGSSQWKLKTNAVFRDCSNWHHLVWSVDTTQSTDSDRVKLYVDGLQVDFATTNYPALNYQSGGINALAPHTIGKYSADFGPDHFDGYLADVHFIDGQALAPTAFGVFDGNSVWQAKEFEGQYNVGEATGGTIDTIKITGNGPHGFHAIRVDGNILVNSSSRNYSNNGQYTTTTSFPYANNQPAKGFDGSIAGPNVPYSAGGEITWAPTGGVTYNSKVEIYVGGVNPFYYNLNDAGPVLAPVNSWTTIAEAPVAGVNGFKLDFSDSSSDVALGYDAAGSNDWTSNNLTPSSPSSTGSFDVAPNSSYPWSLVFDGTIATNSGGHVTMTGGAGSTSVYTFDTPLTGVQTLTLYGYTAQADAIKVNGQSINKTTSGYGQPMVVDSSLFSDGIVSTISITGNNTGSWGRLTAVEVNGVILGPQSNVDSLVDSPTSNYATLNPLFSGQNTPLLSNGNLTYSHNQGVMLGTIPFGKTGKWYFEVEMVGSNAGIGVALGEVSSNQYLGYDVNSWSYYSNMNNPSGGKYTNYNSHYVVTDYGSGYTTGDVIGVAFDSDAGELSFYKNGVSQGVAFTGFNDGKDYFPAVGSGSINVNLNFGQRPFLYPLSGYKAFTVSNLERPIKDSSKHFDVVKYEGNSSTNVISSLGFSPDLVWIKGLNGYSHCLYDTVRGAGKRIATDGPWAEDDYNLLNAFNSDGFTLGTTASGGVYAQNATGDEGVAWCWNAGENSNKTYTVTVVSDNGNKYRFDGHGTSGVTLDLQEGSTYIFDQSDSSNSGHPIRFGTSVNGTDYTTGVTHVGTPGTAGAKTTLVVESGAPGLFYSCGVHSGMGGQINTNTTAGATVLAGSLNNYNTDRVWSSGLSVASGSFDQAATNAFNGEPSNKARTSGDSVLITLTFSPAIDVSNTIELLADTYTGGDFRYTATIDGTTITKDVTGNNPATFGSGSLTQITVDNNVSGGRTSLMYVKIDGKTLVDSNITPPNVPSINSVVKANPEAGFSVVTYSGNSTAGATVAHGLNTEPGMIILKSTSNASNWPVYHAGLTNPEQKLLLLSSTNSETDITTYWNDTKPTSSVFSLGTDQNVNGAYDFVAYCFSPVENHSAIGSFTGNGSPEGPFVYTGFKPSFLMVRSTSGSRQWVMLDSERFPENGPNMPTVYGNSNGAETTNSENYGDFLSNGFKLRATNGNWNGSGEKYIYIAFAEKPYNTTPEVDTSGDTQVVLDPLAAIATDILEIDGTTMYLNGATGPWRTGLSIEGSQINAAPPGPSEITFTTMNDGTTPVSMIDATLSTRTWTLESGASATGPWTLIDSYVDFDATDSQNGATPWTSTKPTLQPNTFYRVKVSYDSTNADSVESVYSTFKTGDA